MDSDYCVHMQKRVREKVWPKLVALLLAIVGLMIVFAIIFAKPASADGTNVPEPPVLEEDGEASAGVSIMDTQLDGTPIYPARVMLAYQGRKNCADGLWLCRTYGIRRPRWIYVYFVGVKSVLVQSFVGNKVYFCPDQKDLRQLAFIEIKGDGGKLLWCGWLRWGYGWQTQSSYAVIPEQYNPATLLLVGNEPDQPPVAWFYFAWGRGWAYHTFTQTGLDHMVWGTRVWQPYPENFPGMWIKRGWLKWRFEPPIFEVPKPVR